MSSLITLIMNQLKFATLVMQPGSHKTQILIYVSPRSLLSMKSLTFPPSSWHFVEVLHGEAPLGTADVSTSALLDQVTEVSFNILVP